MGLIDRLLDASVYFSFDRTGYERHARGFDPAELQVDLAGRTFLVTGANSGIGFATARALAARGAAVRLLCRDRGRGEEALARLEAEGPRVPPRLELLDVSSLADVRRYAESCDAAEISGLVHNAGVLPAERRLTADGLEQTFATHVAGPFLLGRLLEPRLLAGRARVVWVSSGGMYARRLDLDDLDWARRPYDGVAAYAQTKRQQVVLAALEAERLAPRGVEVHAMHPGWADTPAVRTSLPRFWRFTQGRLRSSEQAADTVVWLCLAPAERLRAGRFWFDRAARDPWLLPGTRETPAEREALLALCLRVCGLPAA